MAQLSIEQKQDICQRLGLPADYASYLRVKDQDDELVLVSLEADQFDFSDNPQAQLVRGVVWSVTQQRVVAQTGVFSTKTVRSELTLSPEGDLHLETRHTLQQGDQVREHHLPAGQFLLMPDYEGVKINIFLYGGKVYFATNTNLYILGRKTDGSRYKGGFWRPGSPTYGDQLQSILGPRAELEEFFFPSSERAIRPDSPWCYSVYLVHPSSFLNSSLKTLEQGFAIYYGAFDSGLREDGQEVQPPVDFGASFEDRLGVPVLDRYPYEALPSRSFVVNAANMRDPNRSALLSLEEANNVLRYGVPNPDPESLEFFEELYRHPFPAGGKWALVPGGSLTVTYVPADPTAPYQRFRVLSPSYAYREDIHGHGSNFYQSFISLVHSNARLLLKTPEQAQALLSKVVLMPRPADYQEAQRELQAGVILGDADLYTPSELTKLSKLELRNSLAFLYVLVSNPHNQLMGHRFLARYQHDFNKLLEWVLSMAATSGGPPRQPNTRDGEPLKASEKSLYQEVVVKRILRDAQTSLKNQPRGGKGPKLTLQGLVKSSLERIGADTFFDLVRLMHKVQGTSSVGIADPTAPAVKAARPAMASSAASSASSSSASSLLDLVA